MRLAEEARERTGECLDGGGDEQERERSGPEERHCCALFTEEAACVNVLAAPQQHLSPIFAGMGEGDYEARFGNAGWTTLPNGAYALHGALVSFECRVAQVSEVGTHTVFFLEVQSVHAGDPGEALMYYARKYHTLTPG